LVFYQNFNKVKTQKFVTSLNFLKFPQNMSNISPPDLIRIFQLLGAEMKTWCSDEALLSQVAHENAWFQPEQTRRAINALVKMLQPDLLHDWFSRYPLLPVTVPKTIGVVMAGNLPMVGFHDWLCVLAAGHKLQVKLSSQDRVLFLKLHAFLAEVAPALYARISVVEQLHQPDAVIATGSDNTSRYFDYYFRSYPHIIRKNRNSLAILNGSESNEELVALGHDPLKFTAMSVNFISTSTIMTTRKRSCWSTVSHILTMAFSCFAQGSDWPRLLLCYTTKPIMTPGK
jgi:hypothetical protein